jgi:hypothetical protein
MSSEQKYNGWDNYATWATSLWLDDGEYLEELVSNAGSLSAGADAIKEYVESLYYDGGNELPNGLFSDLMTYALGQINWYEIAEHNKPEAWGDSNQAPDTCTWCDRTLTGDETISGVCEACHNED